MKKHFDFGEAIRLMKSGRLDICRIEVIKCLL